MAGEKRPGRRKDSVGGVGSSRPEPGSSHREIPGTFPESGVVLFLRQHALTFIVFLLSLFFIITVSNPALYMNDEWITANQLHQLDIGHQVTFSEGKYGVTQNGTVSAYFTSRQNILTYSLAFPVTALPVVKAFGLLGDNFRLIVIMIWSLCLVLTALILDTFYPRYARIYGIRILFPVIVLALLLFMGNILLYKQFPFSAPDAPFEVAALVLTNHILFALMVTLVFGTSRRILDNLPLALFGTFACVSCSSYIFWAGAAKDHMLTTTVLAGIIFLYVLYLMHGRMRDAFLSFAAMGLLIWVRPEVGFFVTILAGLFFTIPLFRRVLKKETSPSRFLRSLIPLAGAFVGGIPFFINNLLITHNPVIPILDLPRAMEQAGSVIATPLPQEQLSTIPATINPVINLDLPSTISRLGEMISHSLLSGFTVDNLGGGFAGMMTFPHNGSIGFLIMCPLAVIAVMALLLWKKEIMETIKDKPVFFFLFIMAVAVFLSYITHFSSMNTSHGIVPDMRYLSPAYIPAVLVSMLVLSKTPLLSRPRELVRKTLPRSLILIPLLLLAMIVLHPFGSANAGYFAFFEFIILGETILCSGLMIAYRFYPKERWFLVSALPCLLVLIVITVFSFQFMLTSIYAMVLKFNGYPFWIPLVREGFRVFITVHYLPPV